jgi:hypothetical protein
MEVKYLFRKPAFPVICNINNNLIAARNHEALLKLLEKFTFTEEEYQLIDFNGEGWEFYPNENIISPLTLKKQWTKKELINLYNNSNDISESYPEKSLSNKRFDFIFMDLVKLIIVNQSKNKS